MTEYNPITIEVNGKTYRHDPDFDAYYRVHDQPPETLKQRMIKIGLAVLVLISLLYFFGDPWFFNSIGEKL
jgi:hypothetical protein